MNKYYELDMESLKDAKFEVIIGIKVKGENMNKEQIETIKRGIRCLMIIAERNGDFERKMLNEFMELYDNMEGDEYKYLYVKAIQVDKMLALGLNAIEMLGNDLKSWEKWEKEDA